MSARVEIDTQRIEYIRSNYDAETLDASIGIMQNLNQYALDISDFLIGLNPDNAERAKYLTSVPEHELIEDEKYVFEYGPIISYMPSGYPLGLTLRRTATTIDQQQSDLFSKIAGGNYEIEWEPSKKGTRLRVYEPFSRVVLPPNERVGNIGRLASKNTGILTPNFNNVFLQANKFAREDAAEQISKYCRGLLSILDLEVRD